ncbi:hypothetical protein ACJMK2_008855 [Sinanodonta woodiana]|uniref:AN1-type domain-containing protein n=1 Tax=Sinanodonta woodiana TaxID=1069815 RepID=A0ABD3VAG8_SINWO
MKVPAFKQMAEFTSLGKHCSVPHCKQLDFLPFCCGGCSKIFCSNHRLEDSHDCTRENVIAPSGIYTGPKGYTCSLQGCINKELTPIVCEYCQKSFCLSHRHQQDHTCSKLVEERNAESSEQVTSRTAEHVKHIIASKPAMVRKPKGAKSNKTAARLSLMKMKMSAVGEKGIPEEEKVHLCIYLPQENEKKEIVMYFSKVWSVGHVVDCIADKVGLRNDNNLQHSKKLRLFTSDNGNLLPTEQTLENLVQEDILFSGSSVILKYVDNSCLS